MITFESYRYILDQMRPHEDAMRILDKMFIQKGEHIQSIEFMDDGHFKVVVRNDIR